MLGISIGVAAVVRVVALGNAGSAQIQQLMENLGENFVRVKAGDRNVGGARTGTRGTRTLVLAGRVDQAAGIAWRYRDRNNYYIVRANALEDNVVLYKVENGHRISLAPEGTPSITYGVEHPVPPGKWSALAARARGNLFTVLFDGKELFQVEDNTFGEAGKSGLWTTPDLLTQFDNFTVKLLP